MGATFWSSSSGDLSCHFDPSPLGKGLHNHDEVAGRWCSNNHLGLSILSSAPSYLLPESLWNVWSLASSLSNNTTLSFQWVPGHAGLPVNENEDLLTKAGASLPTDAIPCPLPTSHCQSPLSPVPQLKTSHLPLLSKLPRPRSLLGGTAPFSPYSL